MAKQRTVYMKVTQDRYELPVAIADTVAELAWKVGVDEHFIRSAISREKHGKIRRSVYKRVEIEEEDDTM